MVLILGLGILISDNEILSWLLSKIVLERFANINKYPYIEFPFTLDRVEF